MATIVTRGGKGSALTHAEMDGNLTNLNTDIVNGNVVPTYANTSALTALSSPVNGQLAYVTGTNSLFYYSGSNWYQITGTQV